MSTLAENPPSDARSHYQSAISVLSLVDDEGNPFPGSRREIKEARAHLENARADVGDDSELATAIAEVEATLEISEERRFTGSPWMLGVIGLLICLFWLFPAYSNLTHEEITPEKAAEYLAAEIASYERSMETVGTHGWEESRVADYRAHYEEQLAELRGYTSETYADEMNSRYFWRGMGGLRNGLIWIGFLAAYFYASRPPKFLILRRRRELELLTKGSGIVKKIIFGVIGAVLAVPSTTTITKWSDGTKTSESDALPLMFLKFVIIAAVFFAVAMVMLYALLPLTILNYFRNYREEQIARFTDPVFLKVKSAFGKA
jgi:hypothetical protein